MQKKLIALAIAGLSSAAFAQSSNVTIYGVADGTFEVVKATGSSGVTVPALTGGGVVANSRTLDVATRTRAASNSSYIGVKGVEDLGNGLKAVFQLENQFDLQAGGGGITGLANRDTFVGLSGAFGTVVTGNLTHPIRAMGAAVDFNPGASSVGFAGSIYGELAGVKTGTDDRARNAFAYVSPNFSGLTAVLAYVAGENAANGDQNAAGSYHSQQWQAAATYANGPIYAGVGYHHANNPRVLGAVSQTALGVNVEGAGGLGTLLTDALGVPVGVAATSYKDKLDAWRLVGKYTFGSGTTVSALYDRQKYKYDISFEGTVGGLPAVGSASSFAKRTAWMIGANQNFGKNNVYLQYAKAGKVKTDGDSLEGTSAAQWTLGYTYDLSKRTMLHAYYTELKNKDNVKYDFYINGVSPSYGADPKAIGFGLRHSF